MHHLIILLFFIMPYGSFESSIVVEEEKGSDVRCNHDSICGHGDCWRGFCEENGYCAAYWTCV